MGSQAQKGHPPRSRKMDNLRPGDGHRRQKSRRSRRGKKHRKTQKLDQEDVDFLKENTKFDEAEIREWYKGFSVDCPDGNLGKDKILDMYSMILPVKNATVFVDQIFRIFDKDGNGSIDFKEFMLATDMTASGTPEEKLRWAFKMYDKDGSGSIELPEMIEIIGTLYEMEGVPKDAAGDRANKIFRELDSNGDGELDEDEFVKGCLDDGELMSLLNSGGLSALNNDSDT